MDPSRLPEATSILSPTIIPCTAVTAPDAPARVATIFPDDTSYTMAVLSCPPVTTYSESPLFTEAMQRTPALALLLPKLTFFSFPSDNAPNNASFFSISSGERLSLAMALRPLESFFHVAFMADNSSAGILVKSASAPSSPSVFAFLAATSSSAPSSSLPRFWGSTTAGGAATVASILWSLAKNSSNFPRASSRSLTTRATTLTAASF
mmetsp:Transcript_26862/g.56722  ORF Transcript_26862/g.56722 Transcript_26862/m.56722 type:complete len:208 (-) Transcript_26862:400-1023(-)